MGSAAPRSDEEPITDINVTPLVDVSLVLVIIFMAIAPFAIQAGIKVLESKAKAAVGKVAASDNVTIRLEKDGRLTINGRAAEFSSLLERLLTVLQGSKDKMVILMADDENRVGQVVEVLDTAKQAGARKLAILRHETAAKGRG